LQPSRAVSKLIATPRSPASTAAASTQPDARRVSSGSPVKRSARPRFGRAATIPERAPSRADRAAVQAPAAGPEVDPAAARAESGPGAETAVGPAAVAPAAVGPAAVVA